MRRSIAIAIGHDGETKQVKVYDVHQKVMGDIRWRADTPISNSACNSDEKIERPYCGAL